MSSERARGLSKAPSRAIARLGQQLERNLLAYTAAAGAGLLSFGVPADAQIVYTVSNTPMNIALRNGGPAITHLDLDADGKPDFDFVMTSTSGFSSFGTTTRLKFYLKITPHQKANQAVLGQQAPAAAAVAAGKAIGSQQKFGPAGLYLVNQRFNAPDTISTGSWRNIEYAYVGLKFMINGQVHFGWARIKFPYANGYGFPSIYGYAYESTPNKSIVAGQTSESAQGNAGSAAASLGILAVGAAGVELWRGKNGTTDAR